MLALHEWGDPTDPPLLLVHGLTEISYRLAGCRSPLVLPVSRPRDRSAGTRGIPAVGR